MGEQTNGNFDLDIKIDHVENDTHGTHAWVIHSNIYNNASRSRKITLLNATYVTNYGEQLEQDGFQRGHIIGEDVLMPNSFKKAGIEFYKSKLKNVSSGDVIYIPIELPEDGIKFTFSFQKKENDWLLINKEKAEIEIKLTPKQLEKNLLKAIERFETFEERLEVSIQNLSVRVKDNGWFTLFCELHSTNGTTIKETITIECVAYDKEGLVIKKNTDTAFSEEFFGFKVIEMSFYQNGIVEQVSKIRIYPTK